MKKGSHHTEEVKKKMSIARKGKPNGKKGILHTKEAKRKMSESHKIQARKLSVLTER